MAATSTRRQSKGSRKSSMGKALMSQNRLSAQGITYVKDLEFPADGPGRVIVRLERLMGSDRIRITDTKYMATLLQRLQQEEEITWQKRTHQRRKAEHNRFRQLVIDGYTEPTPGMQNLFNHPVFRVNHILQRLNRLNHVANPFINLPPIVPVEPFQFDETGQVFKSYPGHIQLQFTQQLAQSEGVSEIDEPVVEDKTVQDMKGEFYSKMKPKSMRNKKRSGYITRPSQASLEKHLAQAGMLTPSSDESGRNTAITENKKVDENAKETKTEEPKSLTLQEIQKKYGVAPETDLGTEWKPYQSPIIDYLFADEQRGVWDLYEIGTEITNMYDRQQQTTEDYIRSLLPKNDRSEVTNSELELETPAKINDGRPKRLSEIKDDGVRENELDEYIDTPLSNAGAEVAPTWDDLEQALWEDETDNLIEQEEDEFHGEYQEKL